jgi:hypothetical protein
MSRTPYVTYIRSDGAAGLCMLIVAVKEASANCYCYVITNARCVLTVAVVDNLEGVVSCEV